MVVTVKELWVYPVKACQGIKVAEAKVTATGFEYDRNWCIVDVKGTHVPKLEAISGRRMPSLATIRTSLTKDDLCLDAPGMPQLRLPLATQAYADLPQLTVESAGVTGAGPWSLGYLQCVEYRPASEWINQYLNGSGATTANQHKGLLVHGKTTPGTFAFCRSIGVIELASYPPIFPLLQKSKYRPAYKAKFAGNQRRLSDFAPFLLVSQSSAADLTQKCNADTGASYPTTSFRGNIIIEGAAPWVEENWAQVRIQGDTAAGNHGLLLDNLKPCPRCTVPCRDQCGTGSFLFPKEPLKLWNVLRKAFPRKFSDPEWGSWAGAFMGCYMGHGGAAQEGMTVSVGDTIEVARAVPWDEHLLTGETWRRRAMSLVLGMTAFLLSSYLRKYMDE